MFWKSKALEHSEENDKLLKEIESLKVELKLYKNANESARESFEKYKEDEKKKNNCQVVINFEIMNVFSIERIQDQNYKWKTIIGYFIDNAGEKKVASWSLYITPEQHEALCNEFKDFISL